MAEYLVRYIDNRELYVRSVVLGTRRQRDVHIAAILNNTTEDEISSIRCWTLNSDGSIRANSAVKEWRC